MILIVYFSTLFRSFKMSIWAGLGIWAFSHALDDEDKEIQSFMRICAVTIGVGGILIWAFATPSEPVPDGIVPPVRPLRPQFPHRPVFVGYFRGFAPH